MCLSKDVTGHCSFYCIAIPSSLSLPDFLFSLSHSVSVQRRDRLLFFLLHFFTKAPQFARFLFFSWLFCLPPGFLFALSFHCVSVQRRGRYSVSPFDLIRSLCDLFFFCLHSVSVQRRDRYSVSSLFVSLAPFNLRFSCSLLVTQCICPKT